MDVFNLRHESFRADIDRLVRELQTPSATSGAVHMSVQGQGGRGGNASVGGDGIAIGGPGGPAGKYGRGGDGGGGEVKGDGIAAGGAGGAAGDDGIWRPPAKSGSEVYRTAMGLPVDPGMRQYGRAVRFPAMSPS